MTVDEQTGADIRRLVDQRRHACASWDLAGKVMNDVEHVGAGGQQPHDAVAILVERDIEHGDTITGVGLDLREPFDVALAASYQPLGHRLCAPQTRERRGPSRTALYNPHKHYE